MSWAEDVPGPQNGGVQAAGSDRFFHLDSRLDVSVHQRRRMSHADIDEVADSGLPGRHDCRHAGFEIDLAELLGLAWVGFWGAYQLHERE